MKYALLIILFPFILSSQNVPEIEPMGGGELSRKTGQCIPDDERINILNMLNENVKILREAGKIPSNQLSIQAINLEWPLQKADSLDFPSYYATNNFVDHEITLGILDYNCSNRTYNGHKGSDFDTWPFPWYLYQNDLVEVIAAAAGIILAKTDGNEDNHCSCSGVSNTIIIQHADGSKAWYAHMKRNSLTDKSVGEEVEKGEYLGIVASSGCSTQPHLHFEVYDAQDSLIDPYAGDCNQLNSASWWNDQNSYREPTLNAILTHDSVPIHGCPGSSEDPRFCDVFVRGEPVYMALYYHDEIQGDITTLRIRRPNGSIWRTWTHTSNQTYTKSWWWWYWFFGSNEPAGSWTFEADYRGDTFIREFQYLDPCLEGDYVFTGQAQVDSFPTKHAGTSDISGDVIIQQCESDTIYNLDSLSIIKTIGGSLIIRNNSLLTNLDGLRNLTHVEDDLILDNNALLSDLAGVDSLRSLGGSLQIAANTSLTSFNALRALSSVGGDIDIEFNESLLALNGLELLPGIGGKLNISDNTSLSKLNGFTSLSTVGGAMIIEGNDSLSSLTDLVPLNSITGELLIIGNHALTSLDGLDNLDYSTISNITIRNNQMLSVCEVNSICNYLSLKALPTIKMNAAGCNDALEVLAACGIFTNCLPDGIMFSRQEQIDSFPTNYPACSRIWGSVTIQEAVPGNITSLDSLAQIRYIGGDFNIDGNLSLASLTGLNSLDSIGRSLSIHSNSALNSLEGLEALSAIGSYLLISSNRSLTNLAGLGQIKKIKSRLNISNNPALSDLKGLDSLFYIADDLHISQNDALFDLSGLDQVLVVEGDCQIRSNQFLTDLTGLGKLQSIGGWLDIANNQSLISLNGLNSLESVSGLLSIQSNFELNNLDGLSGISLIGGLAISGNSALTSLSTIAGLDTLMGVLTIASNASLESLKGLDSIKHVSRSVTIWNNKLLENLKGLDQLTTIGDRLEIFHNQTLETLDGLGRLKTIQGLNISNNPVLIDLTSLLSLTTVEHGIQISDNPQLKSLSGLDSVNYLNLGSLFITNCPLLSICELENICKFLNAGGEVTILGNAKGCASVAGVRAACNQSTCLNEGITFSRQEQIDSFPLDYAGCTLIEGDVIIQESQPGEIINLDSLVQIESINGSLRIRNNSDLQSLSGMDRLSHIQDSLCVENNDRLSSLSGLDTLLYLGSLDIHRNDSLTNLKGLENVQTIKGPIAIFSNRLLKNLVGIGSQHSIMGLTLKDNPDLLNLQGLENVFTIGGNLTLSGNASISTLSGLDMVNSIRGNLLIENNDQLWSFHGLDKLGAIGGDLQLIDNPSLTSLTALSSLNSISGLLEINNNDALTSLFGLENVRFTSITDLIIKDSDSLTFCNLQNICDYLSGGGLANISGNALGCETRTEVEKICNMASPYFYEQTWIWQHPLPQGNSLTGINFIDENTGWASGDHGTIIHTKDAGQSWTTQPRVTSDWITDVRFADQSNGWAITDGGKILGTQDAGNSWTIQYSRENTNLSDISVMGNDLVFVLNSGPSNTLLSTNDRGETWIEKSLSSTRSPSSMSIVDTSHIWFCGRHGQIYFSSDQGDSLVAQVSGTESHLYSIDFLNTLTGWVVGNKFIGGQSVSTLLKTSDGGVNWRKQAQFFSTAINWVDFLDDMNGVMTGYDEVLNRSAIWYSSDGGDSWIKQIPAPENLNFLGAFFSEPWRGWLVGSDGLIQQTSNGGDSWSPLSTHLTNGPISDVHFADDQNGWTIGDEVLITNDGGETWTIQETGSSKYWRSVFFIDDLTGWIVGDPWEGDELDPFVLHTRNGGTDWIKQEISSEQRLQSIYFTDPMNGWIAGTGGAIYHTGDGGNRWLRQAMDLTFNELKTIYFVDSLTGWAAGRNAVLKTTDGGTTWEPIILNPGNNFYDIRSVFFVDTSLGYLAGRKQGEGFVLKTVDGGISWNELYINAQFGLQDIFFHDADEGWAIGGAGGIWHTEDGGNTWSGSPFPEAISEGLLALHFPDRGNGWAVGMHGTILHYSGEVMTPAIEVEPTRIKQLVLYPNPNTGMIRIKNQIQDEEFEISVFSLSGNYLRYFLIDGNQAIDLTDLPSGIYFLQTRNQRISETHKVILIK